MEKNHHSNLSLEHRQTGTCTNEVQNTAIPVFFFVVVVFVMHHLGGQEQSSVFNI